MIGGNSNITMEGYRKIGFKMNILISCEVSWGFCLCSPDNTVMFVTNINLN